MSSLTPLIFWVVQVTITHKQYHNVNNENKECILLLVPEDQFQIDIFTFQIKLELKISLYA